MQPFTYRTALEQRRLLRARLDVYQRIIDECYQQAKALLVRHRDALDRLIRALLERETLDEKEILEVTGLPPAPALESARVAAATHE